MKQLTPAELRVLEDLLAPAAADLGAPVLYANAATTRSLRRLGYIDCYQRGTALYFTITDRGRARARVAGLALYEADPQPPQTERSML